MGWLLDVLDAIARWTEEVTPAVPLAALPLSAAGWLAARRALRRRARPSVALALLGVWAEMLSLSCLLLLAAWALSRATDEYGPPLLREVVVYLLGAALVPPAHALRCTLLRLVGRPGRGGPVADTLRRAAWLAFAAVMLVWLHAMAMSIVFPFAGGEFHAMFAYSAGRLDVALVAWTARVLILGAGAVVFAFWIPQPWWTTALLAIAIGLLHWSRVVGWSPQPPHFHRTVVALFYAMPFAILLIAAAGALLRRRVAREQPGAAA